MGSNPIVIKKRRMKITMLMIRRMLQRSLFLTSRISFILKPVFKYWNKSLLLQVVNNHLINYGTPINIIYSWSFGSLAGILLFQIISGLFLAMFYTAHIDLAFSSPEFIMRDVHNGWFVRYIHLNGVSMFFLVAYCHILRGLFYNSYAEPREFLWVSGVILLLLMMATAFLSYVLPWGQISFWGATVITTMFTLVPKVGRSSVEWLLDGYTVNNPTLNRFFTLHSILPSVLVGLVFFHLVLLYGEDSSPPMSDSTVVDQISFYPYFFVKDLFPFFCFIGFFAAFVMYSPNQLGDPNNYIQADSIHTPRHIVPEWYFLPFYVMLRSIPHKVAGIMTMFCSLLIFFIIPFLNFSLIKDSSLKLFFKFCYFVFIVVLVDLVWLRQSPVEDIYIFIGQFITVYYFFFLFIILPFSGLLAIFLTYLFFVSNFWDQKCRSFFLALCAPLRNMLILWLKDNYKYFHVYVLTLYFTFFSAVALMRLSVFWFMANIMLCSLIWYSMGGGVDGETTLFSQLDKSPFEAYPLLDSEPTLDNNTLIPNEEEKQNTCPARPVLITIIHVCVVATTVIIIVGIFFNS